MTDIKAVLVKAREKVADGWTQGTDYDEHGNVCSAGAIDWAVRVLSSPVPRFSGPHYQLRGAATCVVSSAITEVYPDATCHVIDWNDVPGRTQDEVLYVFDHAIKLVDTL